MTRRGAPAEGKKRRDGRQNPDVPREAPPPASAPEPPGRRVQLAVFGAATTVPFAAYWLTHGAGPFWQDAGIFLAGLKNGGGLAPPGYPIYLLLGRPFVALFQALFPERTFAEAVNTFSSVWAALAAGFVALAVLWLASPGYRFFGERPKGGFAPPPTRPGPSLRAFVAALAGVMAGLSYSLWFQAITPETYSLNAFFATLLVFLLVRLGAEGPIPVRPSPVQRRLVVAVFAAHGFSCANHPATVVFLPVLAWLAWTGRAALRDRRLVVTAAAAWAACALLPYAYLPWFASRNPGTLYSGVTSLSGLVANASGSQWTSHEASYGWAPSRFADFPLQAFQELFVAGLAGLVAGLVALRRLGRRFLVFLLALGVPAWLLPMVYLQGGEYDFWLLPFYLLLFVVAGVGLHRLVALAGDAAWRQRVAAGALATVALGPPLAVNVPLVDRRQDHVPEDFARNLFAHLKPNSVLLASSDQECALSLYLVSVEDPRPDVIRVDAPTLALPWYVPYLSARYPGLKLPPGPPPRGEGAGDELLKRLILANLGTRTFYVSKRPVFPLPAPARWVPSGGLWRLDATGTGAVDPADWTYTYRNERPFDRPARNHAPRKLHPDSADSLGEVEREPYTAQIRRFHMQAWKNLGDWQLEHGEYAESVAAYRHVFDLDPSLDHAAVWFGLGKALFAADRPDEAVAALERASGRLGAAAEAEAQLYLGQIAADRKDWKRASASFAAVRRLAPELWKQNEQALREAGLLEDLNATRSRR